MNQAVENGKASAKPPARPVTGVVADLCTLLDGKKTLAAARGISNDALDSLYGVARQLYACGHRAEAMSSLALLCLYDHENALYWQALGICRQKQNDHLGAAAAFTFATGLCDEFDAGLEMQLLECLIAAGHTDLAAIRLSQALDTAGEGASSEPWHAKARLLKAQLAESAASR